MAYRLRTSPTSLTTVCDTVSKFARTSPIALDVLLGSVVLSAVGVAAFSLSGGRVQTDGFLPLFSDCSGQVPIPPEINPAPVLGDAAVTCSAGALPFVVSQRSLIVIGTIRRGPTSTTTFASHSLSTSGAPISAFDASWLGRLGLVAYFTVSLAARGRTLGMRLMGIRLSIRRDTEAWQGVPVSLLFIRTCVAIGGLVLPGLGLVCALGISDERLAYTALIVGILGPIAWIVANVVTIAAGRDPIYDRLVGLTVSVVSRRSTTPCSTG